MAAETRTLFLVVRHRQLPDVECPECHFDAMVQVSVLTLLDTGVSEREMPPFCGRCRAEERRAR